MNALILSNLTHVSEIEESIQEYFLLNDVANVSPTMLWAAHKATIRGKLIQLGLRLCKARQADIIEVRKIISVTHQNDFYRKLYEGNPILENLWNPSN